MTLENRPIPTRGAPAEPSRTDWVQTVRQSIPRLRAILRHLAPTHELESLARLDGAFLRQHGIRGLIWDVDGTLTHYHALELAPEVAAHARRLFAMAELRHAIVSNSDELRYRELGRIFPDIPILKQYEREGSRVGRRLLRGEDSLAGGPAGRAVRKPDAELMRFAAATLGLEPHQVAMVGDQYWTDVAGANLGGLQSIHVPTVGRRTFPLAIRVMQRFEVWVRRILG